MNPTLSSRWQPAFGILAALTALAFAIGFTRSRLRTEVREQLARRDGQILGTQLRRELERQLDEESADPLVAALETALVPEVPGLRTIRLYDARGGFFAALMGPTNTVALPEGTLDRLGSGTTVTRFDARPGAVLQVIVPLNHPRGDGRLGIVSYELDGASLGAEFAELDAHLWRQAVLAFLIAGGATSVALTWAFRRLAVANRLLADRTRRLQRANEELTLTAKTSAVGAVASHLVHGLKNPVLALQQFLSGQGSGDPGEWRDAAATTRRLKDMIDDVVRVLREEQQLTAFEIPPAEVAGILRTRTAPMVAARNARLVLDVGTAGAPSIANRDANLTLLILENLITNALHALPEGKSVRVAAAYGTHRITWRVSDEGPGIPPAQVETLFLPGRTTKAEGTGLGLALSRQLARHLGGDLVLDPAHPAGACFVLTLPVRNATAAAMIGGDGGDPIAAATERPLH